LETIHSHDFARDGGSTFADRSFCSVVQIKVSMFCYV